MTSSTDPYVASESDPDGESAALREPVSSDDSAQPPTWALSAAPAAGLPRRIRVLTGVSEPLLDRISTERPRYTALACVMIGTASIGGISMFFALSEILGTVRFWFTPLALLWSGFVLCLDRWLVASMAGHQLFARIGTAVLRLLVAAVFGFLIAEPLVLRVFDTAIMAQVHKEREQSIGQLQSELAACNPPSGAHPVQAAGYDCTHFDLAVPTPSAADQNQISRLQTQTSQLQTLVTNETNEENALAGKVNNECNGVEGTGLTGRAGNGPACQQDYQAYRNYVSSTPIAAQQAELNDLETRMASLQGIATTDTKATQAQLRAAIAQRVSQQEPAVNDAVGLIERLNALSHLSLESAVVSAAAWTMRLLFVLIDCLPVLVKLASGRTPYDELAGGLVNSARRIFQLELTAREKAAEQRINAELDELNVQSEKRRQNSDFEVRRHAALLEAQEMAAIDEDYERRLSAVVPDGAATDRIEFADVTTAPGAASGNGARHDVGSVNGRVVYGYDGV